VERYDHVSGGPGALPLSDLSHQLVPLRETSKQASSCRGKTSGMCSGMIRLFPGTGNLLESVFIHLSSFQLCFSDWELFCLFSACTGAASTASREASTSFCCGNRGFYHRPMVTWTGKLRFFSINVIKLRRSGASKKVGKGNGHDLPKIFR